MPCEFRDNTGYVTTPTLCAFAALRGYCQPLRNGWAGGTGSGMKLVIPYAHVNDPQCVKVGATLQLPRLSLLLRDLTLVETVTGSEQDLSPVHEQLHARTLGLNAADGRIPWAALAQAQEGGQTHCGDCAWITPAHWQIGMDHILMLDPESLALQEEQSRALMQAMVPYFAQDGIALTFHSPLRWLARGDALADLPSASLDRVCGADVRPWMPATATLRRLQNEMQMLLYTHPVNDVRTAQGLQPVNSFWVHGSGRLDGPLPVGTAPTLAYELRQSALQGDWDGWARAWQQLDQTACSQLLGEWRAKRPAALVLCSERSALVFTAQNRSWGARLRSRFQGASLQQFTPLL